MGAWNTSMKAALVHLCTWYLCHICGSSLRPRKRIQRHLCTSALTTSMITTIDRWQQQRHQSTVIMETRVTKREKKTTLHPFRTSWNWNSEGAPLYFHKNKAEHFWDKIRGDILIELRQGETHRVQWLPEEPQDLRSFRTDLSAWPCLQFCENLCLCGFLRPSNVWISRRRGGTRRGPKTHWVWCLKLYSLSESVFGPFPIRPVQGWKAPGPVIQCSHDCTGH